MLDNEYIYTLLEYDQNSQKNNYGCTNILIRYT